MRKYFVVGSGGALGAVARYELGNLFKIGTGGFPYGTFIINLSGSFILGFFLTLISERYKLRAEWRLFFATGFVGAYTTFSSFTNEVLTLFRQGFVLVGISYSLISLIGGMVLVWLGLLVARLVALGHVKPTPQEAAEQARREILAKMLDEEAKAGPTGILPLEEHGELDPD